MIPASSAVLRVADDLRMDEASMRCAFDWANSTTMDQADNTETADTIQMVMALHSNFNDNNDGNTHMTGTYGCNNNDGEEDDDNDSVTSENNPKWARLKKATSTSPTPAQANIPTAAAPAVAPPVAAAVAPAAFPFRERFAQIRWFRFGLLLRLGLFYFVFFHSRGTPLARKYWIIGGLVFVYLLQIDAISFLYRLLRSLMGINNGPAGNVPNEAGAGAGGGGWISQLEQMAQNGVLIPRARGIVYDILALVISIIGSLFPNWNPHQAILPVDPIAPPAVAAVVGGAGGPQPPNNNRAQPQQQPIAP